MILKTRLAGQTYEFKSIKQVLGKANEEKSGDRLAGLAAENDRERVAAKQVLSELTLADLREHPAVPYETDDVTRIIQDAVNERAYVSIRNWTVAELREWLLSYEADDFAIRRVRYGLTAEMIAAVTKLMSNFDLVLAAKKMRVTATCNTTIGMEGTFSTRLQPNHTTDNVEGIAASTLEGLSYGVGDALIGLNPVNDTVESCKSVLKKFHEIKTKLEIPTQICVLAHVTTQMEAVKQGAPADLIFQSIAGSQKGNEAFGFTTEIIAEARDLMLKHGTAPGPNVLYFETGQGSELSSDAHFDTDQVTMEARCYGFAKRFSPFLVNTVVGFIGPEYLYNSKQVIRAGLEDHFMAKLTGIPMGCDCCYTNHMQADQNDIETLAIMLASAGCNYVIGVPAGDDIMLNYQSTGFHEAASIRELLGLRPIREFEEWLIKMGILENGRLTKKAGDLSVFFPGKEAAHG